MCDWITSLCVIYRHMYFLEQHRLCIAAAAAAFSPSLPTPLPPQLPSPRPSLPSQVRLHRRQYRDKRSSTPIPVVSICGYTNAGERNAL